MFMYRTGILFISVLKFWWMSMLDWITPLLYFVRWFGMTMKHPIIHGFPLANSQRVWHHSCLRSQQVSYIHAVETMTHIFICQHKTFHWNTYPHLSQGCFWRNIEWNSAPEVAVRVVDRRGKLYVGFWGPPQYKDIVLPVDRSPC